MIILTYNYHLSISLSEHFSCTEFLIELNITKCAASIINVTLLAINTKLPSVPNLAY